MVIAYNTDCAGSVCSPGNRSLVENLAQREAVLTVFIIHVVLKHASLISKIRSFTKKWVLNIEIILVVGWEGLRAGRGRVAAFATCGQSGERKYLVLLQFQCETAAAVKELKEKTAPRSRTGAGER